MNFLEWVGQNEDIVLPCILAGGVVAILTLRIVTSTIHHIWLGQQKLELKQSMIDQGMAVDEIERVMKSSARMTLDLLRGRITFSLTAAPCGLSAEPIVLPGDRCSSWVLGLSSTSKRPAD